MSLDRPAGGVAAVLKEPQGAGQRMFEKCYKITLRLFCIFQRKQVKISVSRANCTTKRFV